jgi:hypothetical protein
MHDEDGGAMRATLAQRTEQSAVNLPKILAKLIWWFILTSYDPVSATT